MKNQKLEDFLNGGSTTDLKLSEVEVLKRMRKIKRLCQQKAGEKIGVSRRTMRRFEAGEQVFSKERRRKLLLAYGFTVLELNQFMLGDKDIQDLPAHSVRWKSNRDPKTYRKYAKEIQKSHRVLKILRHQAQLSQKKAGEKCGFKRSFFDHIENGRVELPREKIAHVVKSLGFTLHDFDSLMSQKIIRDELLVECIKLLKKIDDEKLTAVKALLENFA